MSCEEPYSFKLPESRRLEYPHFFSERPVLSILICHLTERKELLDRLLKCLEPQIYRRPVEILIEEDQRQMKTGEKRNRLLDRARGENVCFADDDDMLSDQFIYRILKALDENPGVDCCSLLGELHRKGSKVRQFSHSLKNGPVWREEKTIYLRGPNHLNVVRRDLAIQAGFPEKNIGEDHEFSKRLFPLLKTEAEIKDNLYIYFAGPQ